jgi:hypothetical protein
MSAYVTVQAIQYKHNIAIEPKQGLQYLPLPPTAMIMRTIVKPPARPWIKDSKLFIYSIDNEVQQVNVKLDF